MRISILSLLLAILPTYGFCQSPQTPEVSPEIKPFAVGDNIINVGVGLIDTYYDGSQYYKTEGGIPVHLSYECGTCKRFSVGLGADFVQYIHTFSPPDPSKLIQNYTFVYARGAYHLNYEIERLGIQNERFDVYLGLAIGAASKQTALTNEVIGTYKTSEFLFNSGYYLGTKFYFTPNISAMVEVGETGLSRIRVGLGLKF